MYTNLAFFLGILLYFQNNNSAEHLCTLICYLFISEVIFHTVSGQSGGYDFLFCVNSTIYTF